MTMKRGIDKELLMPRFLFNHLSFLTFYITLIFHNNGQQTKRSATTN